MWILYGTEKESFALKGVFFGTLTVLWLRSRDKPEINGPITLDQTWFFKHP